MPPEGYELAGDGHRITGAVDDAASHVQRARNHASHGALPTAALGPLGALLVGALKPVLGEVLAALTVQEKVLRDTSRAVGAARQAVVEVDAAVAYDFDALRQGIADGLSGRA